MSNTLIKKRNFVAPFYVQVSTAFRLQSHFEEKIYFYPLRPQVFLVVIESKAESTMES